LGITRT